jgi:hypothetical protein
MRRRIIFLILACLLIPKIGMSEMYYWIDDQGIENYSTRVESIPEICRSKAKVLSLPSPSLAPSELKSIQLSRDLTKIPFSPASPLLMQARINGIGPIPLILDTGADLTLISPSTLSKIGLKTENTPPVTVKGLSEIASAKRVLVDFIEVGEAKVGPLLIAVYPADMKEAEGLLGRDFLSNFNLTIDHKEKLVTLTPN